MTSREVQARFPTKLIPTGISHTDLPPRLVPHSAISGHPITDVGGLLETDSPKPSS